MIAVDAWLPSDGLTLEPNALRAAKEQARCLALTAGPGAGKTEMLAQRADSSYEPEPAVIRREYSLSLSKLTPAKT